MEKSKKIVSLFVIVVLMLSLTGCGSQQPQVKTGEPELHNITDMAGREVVVPKEINKVFCVSPVGTIFVYTLNPDLLVGWNYELNSAEKKYILPQYHSLPNLGGWYAKATCNIEELLKVNPDAIFSVGYLDVEQANEIQQQTGIPVVMIDADNFTTLDKAYEFAGKLLNLEDRANELGTYCRETVNDIQAKAATIPEDQKVRVYYAEGASGLETDPKGSRHVETLDIVGGLNVAEVELKGGMGMTPVSLEQVIAWNPEAILSWNDAQGGYYSKILTDPKWASIAAVNNERVYAVPSGPFNWFDRPPSVNRIIGLKWLGNLLYPEIYQYDIAKEAKEFYKKFYHYDLTEEELNSLLKNAGGL
ncbi:MAG: ABC transporter substrate-binding protein [Syntrophomonadaceae bacterium]|jgi:iron complex transport system substrate-binding protein|nr:ABC transporter substrate-binding protein [Bacillota bacterium]NLM89171.1 ABC transporter substrate-binding protein [Syntrophomonadaceae bacterium]HAA08858.1 ABC transporter substrate-binding protein [Syntrophomonas sp.]